MYGSPWIVLPSAMRQLRRRPAIRLRFEQLAQRDLLAVLIRDLDADGRFARNPIDEHRFGLHRQTEVVGEAGDLRVLDAGVRFELERGDDRTRDGSGPPILRPRTRGIFLPADARRPSARVRRSSVRFSARRGARAAATRSRLSAVRRAPWRPVRDRRAAVPAPACSLSAGERRLGADAAEDRRRGRHCSSCFGRLRRLLGFHRRGHRRRLDFRWHAAFLRVLGNHFATLFLATPLFTPFAKRFDDA